MATNSILLFGGSASSIMSQVNYATNAPGGHAVGIADQSLENKALKQLSLLAAGLAQFIADNQTVDIADTLTVQNIADYLADAIEALQVTVPDASTTVKGKIEIATSSEAQTYASSLLALTPATMYAACQGANQSLVANNGYQIHPGGLIEKWGYTDIEADSSGTDKLATVTFSPAFPTACFGVFPVAVQAAGALSENMVPYLGGNPSKTSCEIGLDTHGGPSGPYRVYWRAIGH